MVITSGSGGNLFQGIGPEGDETILVCEDDDAVRRLTTQILTGNGYTVLAAESSSKALELASEHEGTISLLLTDVVMPDMDGQALRDELTARLRDLGVIYMSGYPDAVLAPYGITADNSEFIEKPFLAADLLQLVRSVLDKAKSTTP